MSNYDDLVNNKSDKRPKHYWMAQVTVFYRLMVETPSEDGTVEEVLSGPQQRSMNVIVTSPKKIIAHHDLHRAQMGCKMRVEQENGAKPEHILDMVFGAISYLGNMTPADFEGQAVPTRKN